MLNAQRNAPPNALPGDGVQNDAADSRRRRLLYLLLIAVLSSAIHLFWFTQYSPDAPDSLSFIVPARALVQQHAFLEPPLESTLPLYRDALPHVPGTFRTPGYPLFLAVFLACGASFRVVSFVQHLLVIALTLSLFFAAARVTRSDTLAFITATSFTLYQPVAQFTNGILSESLFLIVLCALMAALYVTAEAARPWWCCIGAGVLAGVAMLVRPVAMYYVFAAALFLLLTRRRAPVAVTALFIISALLLPGAWMLRNARATGVATLSSLPAENLLFFNAAGALVASERGALATLTLPRHSTTFIDDVRARFPELLVAARAEVKRDAADARLRHGPSYGAAAPLPHVEMAKYYQQVGRRIIAQHPVGFFWSSVSAVIGIYLDPLWQLSSIYLGYPAWLAQLLFIPAAIALAVLAASGLVTLFRVQRTLALLLGLTIAYFSVVSSGPATDYRLTLPLAPSYALCLAVGLMRVAERSRARQAGGAGARERSATMRAA